MAYQLSPEDLSMLEIIKVLEEVDKASLYDMASLDKMASMIGFTDTETKRTFGRLHAEIQAAKMSSFVYNSARPEQKEVWTAFVEREAPASNESYAAACEAAAKLIIDTWIDYPRPGTEQPYTPGPFRGSQNRRRVCEAVKQNAETLLLRLSHADHTKQDRSWKFTIVTLFAKLCWYYYELSSHKQASILAERASKMCEDVMKENIILEEHAKWLVLLSDMQQARAVIASDLGDVQTAVTFGKQQLATASAATVSAPPVNTIELARAYMELGKILIIDRQYADAEKHFAKALHVLETLPTYHKLQLYTMLHGQGWIFLMQSAYEKAEECFSKALSDRNAAYGVDDTEGVQTGELLYSLGTVSALQGRMRESHDYFFRGKKQLEQATGTTLHYNIAKLCYKLAGVHIKEHNWDAAMTLFIQCDEYYKTSPHFTGMRARVQNRLSQVYVGQDNILEGAYARILAWRLRKTLKPHDEREPAQLVAGDFEDLVVSWCR